MMEPNTEHNYAVLPYLKGLTQPLAVKSVFCCKKQCNKCQTTQAMLIAPTNCNRYKYITFIKYFCHYVIYMQFPKWRNSSKRSRWGSIQLLYSHHVHPHHRVAHRYTMTLFTTWLWVVMFKPAQ